MATPSTAPTTNARGIPPGAYVRKLTARLSTTKQNLEDARRLGAAVEPAERAFLTASKQLQDYFATSASMPADERRVMYRENLSPAEVAALHRETDPKTWAVLVAGSHDGRRWTVADVRLLNRMNRNIGRARRDAPIAGAAARVTTALQSLNAARRLASDPTAPETERSVWRASAEKRDTELTRAKLALRKLAPSHALVWADASPLPPDIAPAAKAIGALGEALDAVRSALAEAGMTRGLARDVRRAVEGILALPGAVQEDTGVEPHLATIEDAGVDGADADVEVTSTACDQLGELFGAPSGVVSPI